MIAFLSRGHDIDHSEVLEKQGDFEERSGLGRSAGDDAASTIC
jgi:hypothetical protein